MHLFSSGMLAGSSPWVGLVVLLGFARCGGETGSVAPMQAAVPRVDAALIEAPAAAVPWSVREPKQAANTQLECLAEGLRIAASFSGTVEIGGRSIRSGGGSDVFVAEFDAVGQLRTLSTVGGPGNDDVDALDDGLLVLRASDTFTLAGRTVDLPPPHQQYVNPSNTVVIALGAAGQPKDVRAVIPNAAMVRAARLDGDDVVVAAHLYDEHGGPDPSSCVLSRWSAEGAVWTQPFADNFVADLHVHEGAISVASRHFGPDALRLTALDASTGMVRAPSLALPTTAEDWDAAAVVTDGVRLFGHHPLRDADPEAPVRPFVAKPGSPPTALATHGRLYDADGDVALVSIPARSSLEHGGRTYRGVVLLDGERVASMLEKGRNWRGCLGPTHAFVLAECEDEPCIVATPRIGSSD